MAVFRIKNRSPEPKRVEAQKGQPIDLGLPILGKPEKSNRLTMFLAFLGLLLSLAGLGAYISESRMGKKDEGKQYFLTLSVIDSAKQPVPGATLKSQERVVGKTNAAGQWTKAFAIVAGSEYPITVEGADNQGKVETKHVKLVFPHWTKTSSIMNRVIRLETLKNSVSEPSVEASTEPSKEPSKEASASEAIPSPSKPDQIATSAAAEKASSGLAVTDIAKTHVVLPKNVLLKGPITGSLSSVALAKTGAGQPLLDSSTQSIINREISNQPLPAKEISGKAASDKPASDKADQNLSAPESLTKTAALNSQGSSAQSAQSVQKEAQHLASTKTALLPKALASIWFRIEGHSSASSLNRGQSLESIKEKLQIRAKSLGLTLDEKANLTLSLKNLDGKLGSEAQDVIHVDVRLGNQSMETYLRNYQEDALTTARLILWRARLSLPLTYQVKKLGERFIAVQPSDSPALWRLSEGTNLSDESGLRATVGEEIPKALTVPVIGGVRFCQSAAVCRAQLLPGEVSQKGWSKRTLTVLGTSGRKLMIFAAGNPVVESKGEYSYEGPDNGFTVFTVLEDGKIIYRNALHNNLYQQTILTLPVSSISRR